MVLNNFWKDNFWRPIFFKLFTQYSKSNMGKNITEILEYASYRCFHMIRIWAKQAAEVHGVSYLGLVSRVGVFCFFSTGAV